ncbi:MAG: flagellar biosynthesis protein FlhB [Alphaproteobacteria bacterium]
MADDEDQSSKTEDPTERKLQKLRDDGTVPRSKEINSLFMLLAMLGFVLVVVPWQMAEMRDIFGGSLQIVGTTRLEDGGAIAATMMFMVEKFFILLLPVLLLFLVFGYFGGVLQSGVIFSSKPITPDLSKISIMKGFERLFSLKSLAELIKSIFKISVVAAAVWWVLVSYQQELLLLVDMELNGILETTHTLVLYIILAALLIMAVLAAADYLYQKFEFTKEHSMSRKELKDEVKESEGDPHMKGRIRQIRMQRARQRMMQNVPKADVVITNPTHFAVALQYKPDEGMAAPIVVAKGMDTVALRIRELANQHGVTLYEDPPLARQLYYNVEIDDEIPLDLYEVTAKVMAYVFQLKKKKA